MIYVMIYLTPGVGRRFWILLHSVLMSPSASWVSALHLYRTLCIWLTGEKCWKRIWDEAIIVHNQNRPLWGLSCLIPQTFPHCTIPLCSSGTGRSGFSLLYQITPMYLLFYPQPHIRLLLSQVAPCYPVACNRKLSYIGGDYPAIPRCRATAWTHRQLLLRSVE